MGLSGCFYSCICLMMLFGTDSGFGWSSAYKGGCPIFVSSVGLPDIHEFSAG